jgi:hypothetical protein
VWDTHGKQYTIKEHRGWKYIDVANKKIGVSKLQQKPQIRNFDDVVLNYMFCWNVWYPCPAIGYYVFKKHTGQKISLKEYYKKYNNQCQHNTTKAIALHTSTINGK